MILLLQFLLVILSNLVVSGLVFRVEQFTDLTEECRNSEGQPLTFILNEDNPARYLTVDPRYRLNSLDKAMRRADQTKFFSSIAESRLFQDFATDLKAPWATNATLDCVIQVQTELPKGDKSNSRQDALSMIIVELKFAHSSSKPTSHDFLEVSTFGHDGHKKARVTKPAKYSNRILSSTNPNFILSGQLSGFDSVDFRTKIDSQHIIRPDMLRSTFDMPASITVNVSNWRRDSHVYMVFTSYKRQRQRCQEQKEFDCAPHTFLGTHHHLCMSSSLACDGLPNCGQDVLPNQDENCFKLHWSSVLLSLVSYILLAITLLLCLSCFARVLIQWSVRSSLAELRGMSSPTGSFRSSSRLFSFLGTTFSSRWDRPPPTYDEAMKHVNPDLIRQPPREPPAYSSHTNNNASSSTTFSLLPLRRVSNAANRQQHRVGVVSMAETPPPEYDGPPENGAIMDRPQEGNKNIPGPFGRPSVVILPPTPSLEHIPEMVHSGAVGEAAVTSSPKASDIATVKRTVMVSTSNCGSTPTTTTVEAEICI